MASCFIHSLFRTGSTYIWNKFRSLPNTTAYYEPLHNELVDRRKDSILEYDPNTSKSLNHPETDKHYFYEYRDLIDDMGVEYFEDEFTMLGFCNNGPNPKLKKYIDNLLAKAASNVVLQFNRSSLRTKWFKENYPNTFHVYLLRDCKHNFQSYINHAVAGNHYFTAMLVMPVCYNYKHPLFKKAFGLLKVDPKITTFNNDIQYYLNIAKNTSLEVLYYIFCLIWYTSKRMAEKYTDFILDIDRLSTDLSYQSSTEEVFRNKGFEVDFSDAAVGRYPNLCLPESTLQFIYDSVVYEVDELLGVRNGQE